MVDNYWLNGGAISPSSPNTGAMIHSEEAMKEQLTQKQLKILDFSVIESSQNVSSKKKNQDVYDEAAFQINDLYARWKKGSFGETDFGTQ